jgi:hypothetical protein
VLAETVTANIFHPKLIVQLSPTSGRVWIGNLTAVCQPSAVCGQRNERTDDQPRALKQLRHEASLSLA